MNFKCPACGKVCKAELTDEEKAEIAAMTQPTTKTTSSKTKSYSE